MRYYEQILQKDPIFQAIQRVGIEKAAKELKKTQEELEVYLGSLRYQHDSQCFAENELKILDKAGNIVPLKYNFGQRKINEAKERQRKAGRAIRIALLKARQFGGSTLEEGDVFQECMLRGGRSAMIVAHDLDSARHLREMSSRFYDHYRLTKPRLKKETDKWWKFLHAGIESNLRIDTAEELSTGHSLTLHHLHLSEIQNWRNATTLVKGLFPTVPNSIDTTIFMEGTGSGVGDYWYDFCEMAKGSDGWGFVFVPWFEIEDYTLPFSNEDDRANFEAKLDPEEKILFAQRVSLEQLQWRRLQIRDIYKGDIDAFRQQYPANADEAFLTSGRPVFSPISVKERMKQCVPALKRGDFVLKKTEGGEDYVHFSENERGLWELWEEQVRVGENFYCAGVDVAEGIAVVPELGLKGGDFSTVKVLQRKSREMVGKLHARIDPDLLAFEIYKASLYWNYGVLVENNPGGSGNVVIHVLKNRHNVNLLKTVTVDRAHDVQKEEYGWDTNKESKRQMIDELVELIRENRFTDRDKDFWYEASTYIRNEKGQTSGQARKYDDLVIAEAVCFQADKLMPMAFEETPEERREITADMDIPENWQKHSKTPTQALVMEENYVE